MQLIRYSLLSILIMSLSIQGMSRDPRKDDLTNKNFSQLSQYINQRIAPNIKQYNILDVAHNIAINNQILDIPSKMKLLDNLLHLPGHSPQDREHIEFLMYALRHARVYGKTHVNNINAPLDKQGNSFYSLALYRFGGSRNHPVAQELRRRGATYYNPEANAQPDYYPGPTGGNYPPEEGYYPGPTGASYGPITASNKPVAKEVKVAHNAKAKAKVTH